MPIWAIDLDGLEPNEMSKVEADGHPYYEVGEGSPITGKLTWWQRTKDNLKDIGNFLKNTINLVSRIISPQEKVDPFFDAVSVNVGVTFPVVGTEIGGGIGYVKTQGFGIFT